jgi:hypothetical protein
VKAPGRQAPSPEGEPGLPRRAGCTGKPYLKI